MEREKILIIDDEKDFLSLLQGALSGEGYDVVSAVDGDEGLNKAKKDKFDLIICDIRMPKKDGYEVLKGVRQDVDKHLPFIMLTAIEDFKNIEEAYDYEADFYMSKPVEFVSLLKNVRILLNLHKTNTGKKGPRK